MTLSDIEDIALDENFDVFISHRGDLATVSGRAAFEQDIIFHVTRRVQPLIGRPDADPSTIRELARSYTERVVSDIEEIDAIASFDATLPEARPGVLEVTIIYDTGEELTFEVEG